MTPEQNLDHVAAESAHFASVTANALDATIDYLDDWTVRDLVAHLGAVYSNIIAHTPGADPAASGAERAAPAGQAINEWFVERRTALLATLGSADWDAPASTFAGPKTVGWWIRRVASETAVHRWDAEAAAKGLDSIDTVEPVPADLATDAIDEYIEVSLRFSSSRPNRVYPTESLHLHRSDGPGEWMIVSDGHGGVAVTHEHGKGDAAVRGPASALLLWLWGRPSHDIEIFGDDAVALAWRSLAP